MADGRASGDLDRTTPGPTGPPSPTDTADPADPADPGDSADSMGSPESSGSQGSADSGDPARPERAGAAVARGRDHAVEPVAAVRPFLVTAGRVAGTATGRTMPVETQVIATAQGLHALGRLSFEQHDIVAACAVPQSIAELASRLKLHLNVVRVLAEDLRAEGHLAVHVPDAAATHDASVLRRVIDGLRAIPDSRGVLRDTD